MYFFPYCCSFPLYTLMVFYDWLNGVPMAYIITFSSKQLEHPEISCEYIPISTLYTHASWCVAPPNQHNLCSHSMWTRRLRAGVLLPHNPYFASDNASQWLGTTHFKGWAWMRGGGCLKHGECGSICEVHGCCSSPWEGTHQRPWPTMSQIASKKTPKTLITLYIIVQCLQEKQTTKTHTMPKHTLERHKHCHTQTWKRKKNVAKR